MTNFTNIILLQNLHFIYIDGLLTNNLSSLDINTPYYMTLFLRLSGCLKNQFNNLK